MENKRFRNHILSAFESLGGGIIILIFGVVSILPEGMSESGVDTEPAEEITAVLVPFIVGGSVILAIIIAIIIWEFLKWRKTWIIIEDGSISIEKNIIIFKKNTIGIKNISNVNTEQNLLEMILGISKVKINTDSFTTANATDMKIILKKSEAEQLKEWLINNSKKEEIVNEPETISEELVKEKEAEENLSTGECVINTTSKDSFINAIFSTDIIMLIGRISVIIGILCMLVPSLTDGLSEDYITVSEIITLIVIIVAVFPVSLVFETIVKFLKTQGFTAKREKDKIFIKYGIIKQVEFSVPVDRINAVVISQTLLSRIFHKYTAEFVNVGMGDEQGKDDFFCLYCSKEKLMHTIDMLLPEFSGAVNFEVEKQPKKAMIIYFINFLIISAIIAVAEYVAVHVFNMPYANIAVRVGIGISAFILLSLFLSYSTRGMNINGEYINLRRGIFKTKHTVLKFDKIQYVMIQKNILSEMLGISKGTVCILAMLGKNLWELPYFEKDKTEKIKERLLKY